MPDLPEVTQEWAADVGPYVAAMGALIDATARARDAAVADMAAIQAAIDGIHGGDLNIDVNAAGLNEAAAAARTAAAADENLAHAADDVTRATYEETAATDAAIRADLAAAAAAEARAKAQEDAAESARIDALMMEMASENLDDYTVHDQDWINTQKVMASAAASTAKAFALRDIEARAAADADKALSDADDQVAAKAVTASNALRVLNRGPGGKNRRSELIERVAHVVSENLGDFREIAQLRILRGHFQPVGQFYPVTVLQCNRGNVGRADL